MNSVFDWIGRIADISSLVLLGPVLWTWWHLTVGARRREQRWLREVSAHRGARPGVLILDLLPGKDNTAAVHACLAADEALRSLPAERIVRVSRDVRVTAEAMPALAREVRQAEGRLLAAGCDVIHLFIAGPLVVAAMVGAELSNGPRVILWHHEQGRYENFGPLEPLRESR